MAVDIQLNMDLHLTWDGLTGPEINYVVQYRVSETSGPWITAATGIHVNYYDVLDIDNNFYDVKVLHYCNNSVVEITYFTVGTSSCPLPKFTNYTITEDNPVEQKITINFSEAGPSIKVRITRLNDNVIVLTENTTSSGTYSFTLQKSAIRNNTYLVEIANDCETSDSEFVSMGQYSVQKISQGINISFIDSCNCNGNTPIFTFLRQDASGTYINPLGVPRGLYLINIAIPKGTCSTSKDLTMLLEVLQGSTVVLSNTSTVEQVNNIYTFPYSSIDLKKGTYTGQFATDLKLTLTCS